MFGMAEPDYILDLSHQPAVAGGGKPIPEGSLRGRPWIAVTWKCCQTYSRIYRNKQGTAYEGKCPKCGSPVRATIGQGGTSTRFFEAQ